MKLGGIGYITLNSVGIVYSHGVSFLDILDMLAQFQLKQLHPAHLHSNGSFHWLLYSSLPVSKCSVASLYIVKQLPLPIPSGSCISVVMVSEVEAVVL